MRQIVAVLMLFALVAATSATAFARGAPPSKKSFVTASVIVTPEAPVVSSVPPLTVGYDVIQNLSESQTLKTSVTTERRRQSTTGARRADLKQSHTSNQTPEIVLLA
jgi:hypothetical protein